MPGITLALSRWTQDGEIVWALHGPRWVGKPSLDTGLVWQYTVEDGIVREVHPDRDPCGEHMEAQSVTGRSLQHPAESELYEAILEQYVNQKE
jgi:hypothetical protein